MRDVALMPERDVFHRRQGVTPHHAGKPSDIFRKNRITLARHRRGALLLLGEELFCLENFGALQMTNLSCKPLDRRRNNAKSGEVHGMAVTRNDLRRNWLYREPHGLGYVSFNTRVNLRKCPHRSRDGARCDLFSCGDKALTSPRKFGIGVCQFETKCGWFRMNAVRAPNGWRQLVFECAPF